MLVLSKKASWLRLVFSFRGSALARVKYRLLAVFLVALVLTILEEFHVYYTPPIGIGTLAPMAVTLGIFLGFRNNTAYDRYWEGRKLWGALVNSARSFARSRMAFRSDASPLESAGQSMRPANPKPAASVTEDVKLVIAFVHSLRLHLRGQLKKTALEPWLPEPLLSEVRQHANVPNAILLALSAKLRAASQRGELSEYRHVELERIVTEFSNIQGGCERIKNTPIPHSYNILIHSIVALYVFALPFGFVRDLHWYTPALVVIVAYTFLGLDAVGDEIEDPFGEDLNDLPLLTLSRMIEVNLLQMLGEKDVPELLHPIDGRLS